MELATSQDAERTSWNSMGYLGEDAIGRVEIEKYDVIVTSHGVVGDCGRAPVR